MPHDRINTDIADAMGVLGLPEALAWEPAYLCPNGHANHDDGCRHVCGQFDQEIGDACVTCQAPIGRGGPRDFRDPRWLLPALEAYSDKTGWRPIHEYAGGGDYIASFRLVMNRTRDGPTIGGKARMPGANPSTRPLPSWCRTHPSTRRETPVRLRVSVVSHCSSELVPGFIRPDEVGSPIPSSPQSSVRRHRPLGLWR